MMKRTLIVAVAAALMATLVSLGHAGKAGPLLAQAGAAGLGLLALYGFHVTLHSETPEPEARLSTALEAARAAEARAQRASRRLLEGAQREAILHSMRASSPRERPMPAAPPRRGDPPCGSKEVEDLPLAYPIAG